MKSAKFIVCMLFLFAVIAFIPAEFAFAYFSIDEHSVLYRIYSDDISALSVGQKYAAANMPNTTAFAVVAPGIQGAIPGEPKLIVVNQSLANNNINFMFTKGIWSNMVGRVDMLGSIEFDKYISPSFGYPLKKDYTVMAGADYSKKSINILNDMHLYPGIYVFSVENMGFRNKKSLLNLTVQRME
jgi:hypothetical protein